MQLTKVWQLKELRHVDIRPGDGSLASPRSHQKTGTFLNSTFDKMWSAMTEGFSPPSEVAQLDCCRDGWPGAAGEPSEVVQPGKGRVRILEPSRIKPPMGW